MSYLLACVHSWLWHLTYGMWKGYCETRTYGNNNALVALTSTDSEYRIRKVFWTTTNWLTTMKAREPQRESNK